MFASVVIKASMVAMLGQIIPEPLAIAPNFTVFPPSSVSAIICLGCVSVVMMAWAAFLLSASESSATAADTPSRILSMGRFTPITPVEATATRFAAQDNFSAAKAAVSFASFSPCSPVQALAQPALATTARRAPPDTAAFETSTQAARTALVVKTPAAVASTSLTISATSRLPLFLMPALTPAVLNPWGKAAPFNSSSFFSILILPIFFYLRIHRRKVKPFGFIKTAGDVEILYRLACRALY